jgi:hypothetical protein
LLSVNDSVLLITKTLLSICMLRLLGEEGAQGRATWRVGKSTDKNGKSCMHIILGELLLSLMRWNVIKVNNSDVDSRSGVLVSKDTLLRFPQEVRPGEDHSAQAEIDIVTDEVVDTRMVIRDMCKQHLLAPVSKQLVQETVVVAVSKFLITSTLECTPIKVCEEDGVLNVLIDVPPGAIRDAHDLVKIWMSQTLIAVQEEGVVEIFPELKSEIERVLAMHLPTESNDNEPNDNLQQGGNPTASSSANDAQLVRCCITNCQNS